MHVSCKFEEPRLRQLISNLRHIGGNRTLFTPRRKPHNKWGAHVAGGLRTPPMQRGRSRPNLLACKQGREQATGSWGNCSVEAHGSANLLKPGRHTKGRQLEPSRIATVVGAGQVLPQGLVGLLAFSTPILRGHAEALVLLHVAAAWPCFGCSAVRGYEPSAKQGDSAASSDRPTNKGLRLHFPMIFPGLATSKCNGST